METDYNAYLKTCREAAKNEEVFRNFKCNPDYTPILEHVSFSQGLGYIEEINRLDSDFLLPSVLNIFRTNDYTGNPHIYYYGELKISISPTTLRYIKVLADLVSLFGNLDRLNIVEIGGGYGGQCKVINSLYIPASYTIVDLPEVLLLCKKYLGKNGIKDVILRNTDDPEEKHYGLCISNYAFSEVGREHQTFYAGRIIANSDRGYMTCNFIDPKNFTKDEIFALKSNYKVYEEKPLTGAGNLIYTWK